MGCDVVWQYFLLFCIKVDTVACSFFYLPFTNAQVLQLARSIVWVVKREVILPSGETTLAQVPQIYCFFKEHLLSNGVFLFGLNWYGIYRWLFKGE